MVMFLSSIRNKTDTETKMNKLVGFNKGRFCNTIASVALVHTSIQSD